MNTVLWILQIVLAVVFAGAGLAKLVLSRERLRATLGDGLDGVSTPAVRLLGAAEVAAAVGLTVPPAVGVAPVLTPLAALGVVAVMVGAIIIHARKREHASVASNVVLLIMAAVVVWGRFGPFAF